MAEISAETVKELRGITNVGMMECKKALVETGGDIEKATKLLRKMGMAVAQKKSTRTANEGLIATAAADNDKVVSLVEVHCETDFVARNEVFRKFVEQLAVRACGTDDALSDQCKDETTAKIAELGENIIVHRNTRLALSGTGLMQAYVHINGKIGVLMELGCDKPETAGKDGFRELCRDIILHIAASAPEYMTPEEVPQDMLDSEREIYASQVTGKPADVVDKIVEGKLKKFCAEICLLEQGFVKEPKKSVKTLLAEKCKELGDTIAVRRFVRYQVGR